MSEYKVGDRVKVVKLTGDPESEGHEEVQNYLGQVGNVYGISMAFFGVGVDFHNGMKLWFRREELELLP